MRLPKSVVITGKRVKVVTDPTREDASCDMEACVMIIGTKNPLDVLENFLHECLESILLSRGNRYTVYEEGNDKMLLAMSHAEFENAVKDLAHAIQGVTKQ